MVIGMDGIHINELVFIHQDKYFYKRVTVHIIPDIGDQFYQSLNIICDECG